ncbi:hypothetical protein LOTGIDRAFT_145719, partial [Lottia gigantea]
GSKENISNYRPISILPTISKIFEKHNISINIKTFFNNFNLFYINQSGFGQNYSCSTAPIRITDN